MSLESSITSPPQGPVKWGWLTKMLTAIAKAARAINRDGTLEIDHTTGGIVIRPRDRIIGAENEPVESWALTRGQDGSYEIGGGIVDVLGYSVTVSGTSLLVPEGYILALRVKYQITPLAYDQPPILNTLFTLPDVVAEPLIEWLAITSITLNSYRVAVPRLTDLGAIGIPVAVMKNGTLERHMPQRDFAIAVTHHDFTLIVP